MKNQVTEPAAAGKLTGRRSSHVLLRSSTLTVLLSLVIVAVSASSALAASPWWHLTSGARPTYLHGGAAKNEVWQLTVSAAEGRVVLRDTATSARIGVGVDEAPAEVQEGLEGIYGAHNVEVTGRAGPAAEHEYEVYEIKFAGELASQPVQLMTLGNALEGGAERGEIEELVKGSSDGELVAFAENLGDEPVNGAPEPVEITDTLPEHLRAAGVAASVVHEGAINELSPLPCVVDSPSRVSCTLAAALAPYAQIEVRVAVDVEPGAATGEENTVSVTGGQARAASLKRPLTFSAAATPFGVEDYELVNEEAGGAPDTRAGSHPYQQSTTIALNQGADAAPLENEVHEPKVEPAVLAKDLSFKWPAGLIGNPTPFSRCTLAQFITKTSKGVNECPTQSAIGVASVTVREPAVIGYATFTVPLFNLEPLVGEPARFGFFIPAADAPVYIDTAVRTGGDYGITVSSHNITQTAGFLSARVTVWGVPGAPEHAAMRGWGCLYESSGVAAEEHGPCEPSVEQHPAPFLTLPTSCPVNGLTGQREGLVSTVEGDSWAQPEPRKLELLGESRLPALAGCNRLPFSPEVRVSPDGHEASSPSGLNVDVHVPQEGQLNAAGLAQSNIRDIAVTLPKGVAVNPASADGLQACTEEQVGYLPAASSPQSGELHFSEKLPSPLVAGVNFCPDASKIGEVSIVTPLLPKGEPLKGAVYLAAPQNFVGFPEENPFQSLIAMYIVAEDPVSGALVKLPGKVALNPVSGQLESTFEDTPQLAFEDAELHFFGGERAPLTTPARCGSYTTAATFTPWSGNEAVTWTSTFQITSGPNGSACPGASLPFSPALAAGTTNNNAGAFSPLTTTISRVDGQQNISSVQLSFPPGVSGLLSGVKLCPEAQANAGTCGPESQIGETIVSVGLGGDPFTVTGGKAYITGPYEGAPFGLSIVNPAKAGPFDLQHGSPVVVRAKVEVDPHTAALTITTDPPGSPHAIPTIIEGIPLQIKHVNVTVNTAGAQPNRFTFNPTNCNPMAITGTIKSAEGASAPVSEPLQVTNCASLKFAPKFSVSASGKTSKANGASLTAKLSYPTAAQGTQANITRVKVDLPKQLPSRLTTLQKACTNAQFEANPANCPSASKIGFAKVTTPLLPVPLEGPAIFVSHGGEAFPSLTMVLQGYGVTVDLVGTTFISKAGITSTTFKTVPDVPFNTFQLTLPQGKYSALAANGNLCTSKLAMPTEFLAQNGAKINESTAISVSGCKKAKALTRAQKLKAALKVCHKKAKGKRSGCEKAAWKRFGAAHPVKKSKKKQ
jgi:hypothetical protein